MVDKHTGDVLLTIAEMTRAERYAVETGAVASSFDLMGHAAAGVGDAFLQHFGDACRAVVLCGPGNNGGDGYAAAAFLRARGVNVVVHAFGEPKPQSDAARAQGLWQGPVAPPADLALCAGDVVIDAMLGAGLDREIGGVIAETIALVNASNVPVLAVDLPSGVNGDSGQAMGVSIRATRTVTFFTRKPGHLLYPGRTLCGQVDVADIGVPIAALSAIQPRCRANAPSWWRAHLPRAAFDTHKYTRGAVVVFSGGASSTGAARLAATAAGRAGAGAVTVLSPPSAVLVNAAHLTSIMVRRIDDVARAGAFFAAGKHACAVIGPGFGVSEHLRDHVLALLAASDAGGRGLKAVVLDADALTVFAGPTGSADASTSGVHAAFAEGEEIGVAISPSVGDEVADEATGRPLAPGHLLFSAIAASAKAVVMTPHEGEFARLFPDLAADNMLSRLERALTAARRSGAIVAYKGPDTVIAAPDGRAVINANGTPLLATAGSGDVLAGLMAGLLAQGMPGFEAACAAVWAHGEAARAFGPGLIAEDLPLGAAQALGGLA